MTEPIETLKAKLKNYPEIKYKLESDFIEILPQSENGFTVSLYDCGNELIVGYDGWHGHLRDAEEAIDFVLFGLSSRCRLKVFSKGSYEYKWVVQSFDQGNWSDKDATSVLFFPFWRRSTIRYLQNNFLEGV